MSQTNQVTFEVTEACNLKCEYCAFGNLYTKGEKRKSNMMNVKATFQLLDFILNLQTKNRLSSGKKEFGLGFYGGEPMLNISLIKEVVSYAKQKLGTSKEFSVRITTNGTLIADHVDYFAANNIDLLISLDGDEHNHSYRKFHNGNSSYQIVYNNTMKIKNKYPDYFEKHVRFASVLHDRNSSSEIHNYFKKNFSKSSLVMELLN